MRNIITVFPNSVNCVVVSTTVRPVTHTALVLVKNASTKLSHCPFLLDNGRLSKKEPKSIKIINPKIICRLGLCLIRLMFFII